MKRVLYVNELIKWNTGKENDLIERVLWVDPGGVIIYTIDIYSSEGLPLAKRGNDILSAIESGEAEILEQDPMIWVVREDFIKEKDRQKRDEAWTVIADITAPENEPDVYLREKRGSWITKAVAKYGVTYATIYKYLRRYWQRGKNKNALLPDYYNSGGKGKRKKLGDKKVGRPRKNAETIGSGVNVDEATKKIFRLAIKKYFDNPKENFLTVAYELMVKEFFREDYYFEDGVRKTVIKPVNEIPTMTQFRYWHEMEQNIVQSLKARKGDKKYALKHRAVTGKSDEDLIGPGSKYQIDATVADVYLVSRFNRTWIIGRPVIYAVMDCFSRMVVGLYIGLEGPSWIGAAMALANAFSDKVSYCKEYGVNISEEEWPCYHIPQAILGDRGEMESSQADTIVNGLEIRIENTPSYRADWKGIIEQYFNTLDEHVRPHVPGHIDVDFRERGAKDYRLDAKLDMYQFTRIIISCVLYHNNEHWMKKYDPNEFMIEDEINPIPGNLWEWGMVKRSGKLKAYPKDMVKLNLMPIGTATVSEKGIKLKKMFYSCDKAIEEMWFEYARNKGSWKVDIAYDPRNMDYIYIKSEDRKSFIKCTMLNTSRYSGKTFEEIEYLDAYEKLKFDENAGKILQSRVDLRSEIESIVEEAEKMTEEQKDPTISKASLVKGIRNNRKHEKMENRKLEAFELGKDDNKTETTADVIPFKKNEKEDFSFPGNIEYLRKKQKERMAKKNE